MLICLQRFVDCLLIAVDLFADCLVDSFLASKCRWNVLGVKQLQDLGVSLKPRTAQWHDYIEALQSYVEREGHADVLWHGHWPGWDQRPKTQK